MKVRFTEPALADLSAILAYIAEQSPQSAKRVQARIRSAIELLRTHPRVGTRTDDAAVRRLVTTPYPYLIFYEVGTDEITIHAVRHAARDPNLPNRSK
ncbi:type II toxin-antitoxin system RelE/ParE family toxin [Rhodopseudomonas parapalustris]